MKNKTKKLLGVVGIAVTLGILTSCNSFCSSYDSASFRYQHDPINTRFFNDEASAKKFALNDIKKNHKEYGDAIFLDSKGTILDENNIDKLTIDVYANGTHEAKSIVAKASEVFKFPGDSKYITEINAALENTYILRSGSATAYFATTKTDENNKETTSYSAFTNTYSENSFVKKVNENSKKQSISTPLDQYWHDLDEKVITDMISEAASGDKSYFSRFGAEGDLKDKKPKSLFELFYGYSNEAYNDYLFNSDEKTREKKADILIKGGNYTLNNKEVMQLGRNNALFANFGYTKYVEKYDVEAVNGNYWAKIDKWNDEIREENKKSGSYYTMPSDYMKSYKLMMDQEAMQLRTCITIDDGFYGHYGDDDLNNSIKLTDKSSWGDAWKHGFLEGLFVYPIAYMVEYFSHAFGMNGWGQIGAVLLVTIIVRGLFMLVTFKSTLSQQRMQTLQPEIAKLQQKYPNSDTNQYEKQRLAQAQMALYKKYKIHPFSSLLIVFIQFPIFISVWNGFSGAASLTTDAVLGLRLSDTIWSSLTNVNGWPAIGGWWTALVLILLMSAGQIISMQLPRWLQKKQMKEISRTHKNPAESAQQKQMKWVSWIMTAFIIIMGFTLPAAMGVYWFAGALFSMIQSVIMHFIMLNKGKSGKKLATAGAKNHKEPKEHSFKMNKKNKKEDAIEAEIVDNNDKTSKNNKNKK